MVSGASSSFKLGANISCGQGADVVSRRCQRTPWKSGNTTLCRMTGVTSHSHVRSKEIYNSCGQELSAGDD